MTLFTNFWYYVSQKIRPFADVDMDGKKISGLPTTGFPTEDADGATKKYVDDVGGGVSDHADLTNVLPNQHHSQAHTLASHSTKAHSELTGVTASQHHTKFTTAEHDTTTRHPVSVIKTATGSSAGSLSGNGFVNITMHRKSFFPSVSGPSVGSQGFHLNAYLTHQTNYISRLQIQNQFPGTYNYKIYWDYLSSSGPPQIWVIADKEGRLIHCWVAEDPPNPDKLDISPIEVVSEGHDIQRDLQTLKIKIPADYKQMQKIADKKTKSFAQYFLDEYIVNFKTNRLNKKKE